MKVEHLCRIKGKWNNDEYVKGQDEVRTLASRSLKHIKKDEELYQFLSVFTEDIALSADEILVIRSAPVMKTAYDSYGFVDGFCHPLPCHCMSDEEYAKFLKFNDTEFDDALKNIKSWAKVGDPSKFYEEQSQEYPQTMEQGQDKEKFNFPNASELGIKFRTFSLFDAKTGKQKGFLDLEGGSSEENKDPLRDFTIPWNCNGLTAQEIEWLLMALKFNLFEENNKDADETVENYIFKSLNLDEQGKVKGDNFRKLTKLLLESKTFSSAGSEKSYE